MPDRESGPIPRLLSQTGAFKDCRALTPNTDLMPYDINVPFWSDGASKDRWVCLPNDGSASDSKIQVEPAGEWVFPKGTIFVKHFELGIDETRPELKRRLETRLLVCDATGSVYGVTYKWRPDNSDADLLTTNLAEEIAIRTATGVRTQTWYYPSRQDCRVCHTDNAGGVLGVKAIQINREFAVSNGHVENQLRHWNRLGLFDPAYRDEELPTLPRLARLDDRSRSIEERARAYLDANCSQCHRPKGTVAYFDARYTTPIEKQSLLDGPVLIDEGVDRAKVIAPNDIWRSIAYVRVNTLEAMKMPPLAHQTLDKQGIGLLREWIGSLPGPPTLQPPTFSLPAGKYPGPIEVKLSQQEPGAVIRYTLDGSAPASSDPAYQAPIKLTEATTVRARAFKHGFTRSIPVQATFLIGD
ncbi:MAG: chitobiase/beta-hexosaminidase C-terminal domain-containing protein [Limisphaerales bacterium]